MNKNLKEKIEKCTTGKQVKNILAKNNIAISRDDSAEMNSFSVWIDDTTRIYKPYKGKYMIVQEWKKIDVYYSGIPTFFGTDSYF